MFQNKFKVLTKFCVSDCHSGNGSKFFSNTSGHLSPNLWSKQLNVNPSYYPGPSCSKQSQANPKLSSILNSLLQQNDADSCKLIFPTL